MEQFIKIIRQNISVECLWVVADESILHAIRRNTDVYRGPRGKILLSILRFLHWQKLQLMCVLALGFVSAGKILLRQGMNYAKRPRLKEVDGTKGMAIFVGFGARAEEKLFLHYCEHYPGEVIRINQIDIATMAKIHPVGISQFFSKIISAFRSVQSVINKLPDNLDRYRIEWLVFAGMRIATYAYARAWFSTLQYEVPLLHEVCFLSPDTQAFAAIDAGLPCHFYQHGLLSKSNIIPDFKLISALTTYEGNYLTKVLSAPEVSQLLPQQPAVKIAQRKILLVASGNRSYDDMSLVIPLIMEAMYLGLDVLVRPFPGEDLTTFWEPVLQERKLPIQMMSSNGSFDEVVNRITPLFVASWGSTALVDALYMGIIPICVAKLDDPYLDDTVYPLLQCCAHWPRDLEVIRNSCRSQDNYDRVLGALRDNEIIASYD